MPSTFFRPLPSQNLRTFDDNQLRLATPTLVDIDSDGDLDVVSGDRNGNFLFFENTGTSSQANFANPQTNPFGLSDIGSFSTPAFADIDGDGDLDAFSGNLNGAIAFFENTGTASQASFASVQFNPFGLLETVGIAGGTSPTFADIDNDGDLDAFSGNESGTIAFFENTGTATQASFASAQINPFGLSDVGSFSEPVLTDIDDDGDLDLFVGSQSGTINLFENTGTANQASFASAQTAPLGLGNEGGLSSLAFGNLDGDSEVDVLLGTANGSLLFFERNATPVTVNGPITGTDAAEVFIVGNEDLNNFVALIDFQDGRDRIDLSQTDLTSFDDFIDNQSFASGGVSFGSGNSTTADQTGNFVGTAQGGVIVYGDNLTGNQTFLDASDFIFA